MPRRLPLGALFVACVVARVDEEQAAALFRAGLGDGPAPVRHAARTRAQRRRRRRARRPVAC